MKILVCVILGLAFSPLLAHDLWLEREGDVYVLQQGPRDSGHPGAATLPYPPEAAGTGLCADTAGNLREVLAEPPSPVRYRAQCAALLVPFSTGYWTKTVYGTVNRPKDTQQAVVASWRSEEWVKRMERWSEALTRPLSQGLEITPVEDPFGARAGDKLRLRLTLAGRPAAGATMAYDGRPRGLSDPDGRINIRVRHGGTQSLSASLETPLDDGKAARLIRTSVLQLELPAP